MENNEPFDNHKKDMIHYQKINIFGEDGVGKTSFISYLENYDDDNFVIEEENDRNIDDDFILEFSLVKQIKKVPIKLNKDKNLFLNVYETNIREYDMIKINLEILLFQTECIIIMWDNNIETFDKIPNLIKTIKNILDGQKERNKPIILIQNKIDLSLNNSDPIDQDIDIDIDKSIEEIKKEIPTIIYKAISLLNKKDFCNILLEIDKSIDRTKVQNNNEAIDLIKCDYPIKEFLNDDKNNEEIKILLLGDSNTGKTSFLKALSGKDISQSISTNSLNNTIFYAYIKDKKYKIKIIDTPGKGLYKNIINNNNIKDIDGFLLFFDISDEYSFDSINYFIKFINDNNSSKEVILLGNKIDKFDERTVMKNDVKDYAENHNIKYIECSCKLCINIYEILNEIILLSFNRFQEKMNDKRDKIRLVNDNQKTKEIIEKCCNSEL